MPIAGTRGSDPMKPEILIIDELAVGDAAFQTKCMGSSWNFS
jgi:ABC-type polysaccharide/polyol phosphate transport system ATPase subunit